MSTRGEVARVAWLDVRFALNVVLAARRLAGEDLVSALLLGCIVGANLDHLDQRPRDTRRYAHLGSVPDDLRHPVNATSLSDALGVPRETARAKIGALTKAGVLERRDHGVILPSATVMSPDVTAMVAVYLEALAELVNRLASIRACGLEPGQAMAQPAWPVAGAAVRLGSSHVVRSMVYGRNAWPDLGLVDSFVLLAAIHLTGAHLRVGGDLASGGALLTDAPAGPVRGVTVATFLRMPNETVRRHLATLVAKGRLVRGPGGYDVDLGAEALPVWRTAQDRIAAASDHFVWRLRQAGIVTPRRAETTPLESESA